MWISELCHQEERAKVYVGSPSLVRLPDGALLATHDYFGPQVKNLDNQSCLTSVYRSEDDGHTWSHLTFLVGCFWGSLFLLHDRVYLLACAQEYGDLIIRRSDDGGFTWTQPLDEHTGRLFRAGPGWTNPNYQTGPQPLFFNGRVMQPLDVLVNTPEDPTWREDKFQTAILSAPLDADLLQASSWRLSNLLPFDRARLPHPDADCPYSHGGWLEGSIAQAPDGRLAEIIRIQTGLPNKAVRLEVSEDGTRLSCNYDSCLIDFIGGISKCCIRRDPDTGLYLTLTNQILGDFETIRNILVLAASPDLEHWSIAKVLQRDESGLEPELSRQLTGFQYPSWIFDGPDILWLSRTAFRGAHTYHDANRITFDALRNYRTWLPHK